MAEAEPAFCSGCGRAVDGALGGTVGGDTDACPTGGRCRGGYEPPRYCQRCGRRMAVQVTPTDWRARCRDHGELRSVG